MESRFHGVPLSATQMAPKVVPSDSNASPGIRASVTADDSDFEYDGGSSDVESEGFESGEDDELGTDAERPYVSDQDSSSVREGELPAPSGESVGDYMPTKTEFRPLGAVEDEDEVPGKFQVPIAMISRDSDEDSQGSDVLEDDDGDNDGLSGVVRVPSIGLERSFDSASKDRIPEVASEYRAAEESSIASDITSSEGVNGKFQDEVSIDESRASSQLSEQEEVQESDAYGESMDLFESISDGSISALPSSQVTEPCRETVVTELVEQLTFHIDPNVMVVKMEEGCKDLLSYPSEEISCDKTGQIDGLVITDLDTMRPVIQAKSSVAASDESKLALSRGEKKKLDKLQRLRVKYLTLLHRLGFSHEDSVAARVLYHLTAAESRFSSWIPSAEEVQMKRRSQTKEDFDHSLSILVIGKTGVGKSATVNSIFGETKASTDAFQPATVRVREITGTIHGVKVKVFDTPGLRTCVSDQFINRKVLTLIKKTVKKFPPDVVLYVDRLDASATYSNDLPMFKAVDSYLGSSIWSKSIVVLTHANSLPLDESEGSALSYEALVSKWSLSVQQLIRREILQINQSSMPPICLVENNPLKENGEFSSNFGESWRRKLLQLCYSIKTLSEVNSIVSIPNVSTSLPFSLSSLLHSNVAVGPKLSNGYSDREMAKSSHPEQEKGDKYDDICPRKPLARIAVVPLQDIELLPPSFNGDDPSFRYHFSKPSPHFLAGPVLEPHEGWDSEGGHDAILVEYQPDIVGYFPTRLSIQLIKDKDELNLQIHSSASSDEHVDDDGNNMGLNISSGLDVLTLAAKKLSYALKVERNFRNLKKSTSNVGMTLAYPIGQNQTSLGLSFTRLRDEIRYELESRVSIDALNSKLNIRAGLNSKRSAWVSVNTSGCPDQHQLGAVALVSIASAIFKKIFP